MASVNHILIVTLSNIGDVVLTTPVISNIASIYPDAKITVVVGPRARGVLEASRMIHRVVTYDKHASLLEKIKFILQLRENHYSMVVDLRNTLIPFLVSAEKRSPVFRKVNSHLMRDRHLEILKLLRVKISSENHFDFFREQDWLNAQEKIRGRHFGLPSEGYIVVSAAAQSTVKTWKIERFKQVISEILKEFPFSVLLLGDKRESNLSEPLVSVSSSRVLNLCGETSLKESAALIKHSTMVLSNDSALMHLGFEMKVPTVAVFGPTNHHKYGRSGDFVRILRAGSTCSPCELAQCRFQTQFCFEELKPEKVIEACRTLLHAYSA